MSKYDLNENQIKAISSSNQQILVSASAGTGKTFVMVERVIDLILHKKVPIDRFLLVTFANASAEEMRERIHKALYENLDNDFFIVEQLKKLPQASISTLHSFCSDLIRRYFYAIDIPPKFSILEPTKASLLKSRAIETLFEKKYEAKEPDFLRLVDIFSRSRNDEGLSDTLLSLYEFSRGIDDPLLFLSKTAFENYDNPTAFESILSGGIDRKLSELKRSTLDILDYMYSNVLDNDKTLCMNFVVQIDGILAQKTLGLKIQKIAEISFPDLKRLKANCEYNEVNIHKKVGEIKSALIKYLNSIKNYSDYLSNGEAILKIRNDVKMLCALTIEFADAYALEKKKIDSLDFSDLEHFALKLLQNKEVLTDIQDKFDYVFVDEYQDTSKVQEALISAISTHNLFMVGDIKQSIYSFRQCDKNIFAEKEHRYKGNSGGEVVFLNQNFRSGGKILNFVNLVFKNIMTAEVGDDYLANSMFDIKDDKGDVEMDLLVASTDDDAALPKIYSVMEDSQKDDEFVNAEKEGKLIATKIQSLVGTSFFDGKIERKITYSDFAILLRATSSTHAECIYKTLKDSGIPITISSSDSSLLDYPEVCQVINFISVLVNFQKDIPLLSVLRSPFFEFDDNELLEIRKRGTGKFFFECLKTVPADTPIYPKIKRFFDTIQFYKTIALARGGVYSLTRAIAETPFEILTLALPYGGDKMKRVDKFIQLISSLDENKNLVELHLSIEKLKDELQLKDSDVTNDAVKMMSIHKSKGLEFPICFVGGITSSFNFKSAASNVLFHSKYGVTIRDFDTEKRRRKDSLPYFAISQLIKDESIEEELRILYVALTRAKNRLFLTGIVKNKADGIASLSDLKIEPITTAEGIYSARSYLDFIVGGIFNEPDRGISINFVPDTLEKQPVQKLALDLSHLSTQARSTLENNLAYRYPHLENASLPTKFSASSLKRSPHIEEDVAYTVKSRFTEDASQIGIAYHKILELSKPFDNLDSVKKTVADILDKKLIPLDIMDKVDLNSCVKTLALPFMSFGVPIAEKAFIGFFEADMFTEFKSSARVLIQGVVDLLLYNEKSNSCVLVDYKFSSVDNDDVLKARYFDQLRIYHYAVTHILQIPVEKTFIVNVRNGHAIELAL